MKTDYNRIKVSDLEKNDPDKILITNQNGELEFSDLNNIQKDNYNALDYTSEGKALDARQGKVLKELIDNISSETTTAIEKLTIIDNDKIIINDSETSFLKKSVKLLNVKAALKTYFDTIYQSFMSVVTVSGISYQLLLSDNGKKIMFTSARAVSLTIPTDAAVALPIGAKIKIVQQGDGIVILSTTGLTIVSSSPLYTIKGQTIILEKTAVNTWTIEGNNLNGEVRLPAYPNTRNDGQINNNKVLGTDANGNLRMFSIATNPAPHLDVLLPDSTLPSTTTNVTFKGAFFTPNMTVSIAGQIVNYITFKSDNLILVNVTTGPNEGQFAVTLNNGLSAVFPNSFLVVLGTVFKPSVDDWVNKSSQLDVSEEGTAKIGIFNLYQSATWNKQLDFTKNFRVQFYYKRSPFGNPTGTNETLIPHLSLNKSSDNSVLFYWNIKDETFGNVMVNTFSVASGYQNGTDYFTSMPISNYDLFESKTMEFRYISGVMYVYTNNVLRRSFSDVVTENLKVNVKLKYFDLVGIKYIETV